jgi:hypothetical protein
MNHDYLFPRRQPRTGSIILEQSFHITTVDARQVLRPSWMKDTKLATSTATPITQDHQRGLDGTTDFEKLHGLNRRFPGALDESGNAPQFGHHLPRQLVHLPSDHDYLTSSCSLLSA